MIILELLGASGTTPLSVTGSAAGSSTLTTFIGANLQGINNSNLTEEFTDLVLGAGPWLVSSGASAIPVGSLDSGGWPQSDFQTQLMAMQGASTTNGGSYAFTFTGNATISVQTDAGVSTPFSNYNSTTNTTVGAFSLAAGNVLVIMTFTSTQRTNGGATNAGLTNLHVYRPGFNSSSSIFNTKFLNHVKPRYPVLRYMDWLDTANTALLPQSISFSQRPTPANSPQIRSALACSQGHGGNAGPISWELIVLMANQTGSDPWINIPYAYTDAAVTALAQFLQPAGSGQASNYLLNSTCNIYVEFSNELWNTGQIQGVANYVDAGVENKSYDNNFMSSSSVTAGVCTVTFLTTFTGGGQLTGTQPGNPSRSGGHTLTNGQTVQHQGVCDTTGTRYASTITVVSSTVITFTVPSGSPNFGASPGAVAFTGNSALLGTFGTPVTYDVPTAGTIVSGTNIDPHNLSYRRTAQRICQVSDLFRAVWGNTAMNTRIRCVYANQAQGPGQLLNGLTMINAALPHPPAYYLYAIAGAPYFFPSSSATTASYTSAQIITDIYTKNDNPGNNATINDTPYQVGNATFFALPGGYFSYEFGFENGANTVNRANRDAAMTATAATLGLAYDMGTITVDLYSQLYAQGATLQMQFTAGARGVGDGIYYPTNQDSALAACVRLNAIDTVKANGPGTPTAVAAVTLGTAVLAKTCYNLTQTGDFSLQLPYGFPHEAFWLFYLNPTNAGARNLIFNTSSGNAACTYNFYVDNVLVGGNISMPTGNTASMSFNLTGGLHAIRALPTANPSGVNLHSWTLS